MWIRNFFSFEWDHEITAHKHKHRKANIKETAKLVGVSRWWCSRVRSNPSCHMSRWESNHRTLTSLENAAFCNRRLTSACWICSCWSLTFPWWSLKCAESSGTVSWPERVGVLLKEISLTSYHVFVKYAWVEFPLILIFEAKKQALVNAHRLSVFIKCFSYMWSYWLLFYSQLQIINLLYFVCEYQLWFV